jgi:hypothetical protein
MNSAHHALARTMEDPPFYYVWDGTLISVLMFWTLAGLWIWLSLADRVRQRRAFSAASAIFIAAFCGPGALVAALWIVTHRQKVIGFGKSTNKWGLEAPSNCWRN